MSTAKQFHKFHDDFVATLSAQTGLSMGEYAGLVLSGQNPSFRSDVSIFAEKLIKRRKKGKSLKAHDVDALLTMVMAYMAYQELTGRDRIAYSKQVLQKIIPALTSTDMQAGGIDEIHSLPVGKEMRKQIRKVLDSGEYEL